MKVFEALKQLRELSKNNIPFSIQFLTCNTTTGVSNGLKTVNKCLLRTGLSSEHSHKANVLIAYTDLDTNKPGQFYMPLLFKFNNIELE